MNAAYPVIRSIGPPPERHAERMAIEFARWLVADEQRRYPAWKRAIKNRSDGNPKGQNRLLDALIEAAGPALLGYGLQPGKRRKYALSLHHLCGWDKGDLVDMDGPVPPAPWLALVLELITCTYATVKQERICVGLISQHAIARLAERCGARDPHDVIDIARTMSIALLKALNKLYRDEEPPEGWRVPFTGGIAVIRIDPETNYPLVVTVLPFTETVPSRTEIA